MISAIAAPSFMGVSPFFGVAVLLCGDWNRKRGAGKACSKQHCEVLAALAASLEGWARSVGVCGAPLRRRAGARLPGHDGGKTVIARSPCDEAIQRSRRNRRVGKAIGRANARPMACPPFSRPTIMMGTAQERLCPPTKLRATPIANEVS